MSWSTLSDLEQYDECLSSSTNEVYETPDSYVKVLNDSSLTCLSRSTKTAIHGEFNWPSAEERYENELLAAEELPEYGIKVPEIIDSGELEEGLKYIETEKIEGKQAIAYLEQTDDIEALQEIGAIEGRRLRRLHDEGRSPIDGSWQNRIVSDSGELYWVDHEFYNNDVSDWEMFGDLGKVLKSILKLPPDKFDQVREGFESGYGDEFSPVHAAKGTVFNVAVGAFLDENRKQINTLVNSANQLR